MTRSIRIDEDVAAALKARAEPFDTRNDAVLRAFGDDICARLRPLGEYLVPTFTTPEQVAQFLRLRVTLTGEMRTSNGVTWTATLLDTRTEQSIGVENRGDGGCNWYQGDRGAIAEAETFASSIYPGQCEALDTLCLAVEANNPKAKEQQ